MKGLELRSKESLPAVWRPTSGVVYARRRKAHLAHRLVAGGTACRAGDVASAAVDWAFVASAA